MTNDTTLPARRIPVILDTDIGDDIDDTWALALLLHSPELEVKLVTTATGDTTYRARLTARLLEVAGRIDVPVGIGPAGPVRTPPRQADWVEGYALEQYPGTVHADGVPAMIDVIMGSPEPVTLISIGPLTDIAAALRREPGIAERTRFVGMQGSLREHMTSNLTVAMGEGACAEWNVVSDISASQTVFAAPWLEATLSPVDTCARIVVDGERYQRLLAGTAPFLRALLENYRLWAVSHGEHCHPEAQSSVLFDCEAVHLAHTTRWLRMRRMGVRVDDQGYTREDAAARPFNVAMAWEDYGAFADDLTARLLGASTSPGGSQYAVAAP
jgi:inosine-uridine nucleoside N-ribohydrolase